jgi:hypothetical protein
MEVAVIGKHKLHFLPEGLRELGLLSLAETADEVVGIELRNRLQPADLTEIMEDVVGNMSE